MAAARSPPAFDPAEKVVLASQGDDAQRAFGGVVVDLELAIVDIAGEGPPAREGVADRRRRIGLAGELRERVFDPGAQTVEQRSCPCLTDRSADLRRAAADLGLDGVERGDALDRFCSRRRGVSNMDLVELASGMCPTRDFVDRCLLHRDAGSQRRHRPEAHPV